MAGRQRTTFAKLQKERARQEKQAAKRARRQGLEPIEPVEPTPAVNLNDPSTWKYADEIEAEKEAAAQAGDAEPADENAPAAPAASDNA
jgi:hypothetical protein